MLQITPEITQDSLRSDTKDGGSFWTFKIKGKGLCCKFFFFYFDTFDKRDKCCLYAYAMDNLDSVLPFAPIPFRSFMCCIL